MQAMTTPRRFAVQAAAIGSAGAGLVHAAAVGTHAEESTLVWLFALCAIAQVGIAGLVLLRPTRPMLATLAAINAAAFGCWALSRTTGLPVPTALREVEAVGTADLIGALFAVLAVCGALAFVIRPATKRVLGPTWTAITLVAALVLSVPALAAGANHDHSHTAGHDHGAEDHGSHDMGAHTEHADHSDDANHAAGETHDHDAGASTTDHADHSTSDHSDGHDHDSTQVAGATTTNHNHSTTDPTHHSTTDPTHHSTTDPGHHSTTDPGHHDPSTPADPNHQHPPTTDPTQPTDPNHHHPPTTDPTDPTDPHVHPVDPTGPIISLDDPRLTAAQKTAAQQLITVSTEAMARFSDTASVEAAGYNSIGDGGTGWEHFVNGAYLGDQYELDPAHVEAIVFQVMPDGSKHLASAMYILSLGKTMADAPDIAGELTTWHDHQNLCWSVSPVLRVIGTTNADGSCTRGVFIATPPMLHVWMQPHPCGPFAGIDGTHGAGCGSHDHPTDPAPTGPITSIDDPRLTVAQRTAAQRLIDVTKVGMAGLVDVASVEAAGYRSIGDAGTGWEHFVNWTYYSDGIEMDPARIESVVFQVMPDGSKHVASAMYILNTDKTMADVPDIAGELTVWHDHQNLCWSLSGTPRVVGITNADGSCTRGQFIATPPMLHVWMQPHDCGPFAGIDGSAHGDCATHQH